MKKHAATEELTVFPTIGKWPYASFKRFQDYANKQTGGVYWVAIDKLLERSARLDLYESDVEDENMIDIEEQKPSFSTLGDDYYG